MHGVAARESAQCALRCVAMTDAPLPSVPALPADSFTKRAWVALALSLGSFGVFYVATWPLARFVAPELEGWGGVALIATLIVVGAVLQWLAIPVVAHTLGRMLDKRTHFKPMASRVKTFALYGALLGIVPAVFVIVAMGITSWVPVVNFVVPAALAGAVTAALLPTALRSIPVRAAAIAVAALVLAAPFILLAWMFLAS